MTIVSNSDIETAQKCERMFYYSRVLGLRLRELPIFIRRGSFGHELMEEGFNILLVGGSIGEATEAASKVLEKLLNSGDPEAHEMMKVYRHAVTFLNYAATEAPWRPVAVEDRGMWNITQDKPMPADDDSWQEDPQYKFDRIFGYTPDLVVEFIKGPYRGQHAVLDYKFLAQYMKEVALNMAQQIPKYLIYRNKTHTDFKVRRGAFVQFNTRATPQDSGSKLYLTKWLGPEDSLSRARLARVEWENNRLVGKVAEMYENPDSDNFLRTVNKDVCERCFYQEICKAEFDGKPLVTIDKIKARTYMKNDYGYTVTNANG